MRATMGSFLRLPVYWMYAVSLAAILGSNVAAAQSVNVSQVTGVIQKVGNSNRGGNVAV